MLSEKSTGNIFKVNCRDGIMSLNFSFLRAQLLVLTSIACIVPTQAQEKAESGATVPAQSPASTSYLSVLPFKGPQEVSVETDLGYKVKSGEFSDPYKDDFENLGRALQKSFVSQLQKRLNQSVIATQTGPTNDSVDRPVVNSKYYLEGVVDKVRFQGNTLIPNYYELTLSAQLVSSADHHAVWHIHHKLFARMFKTRRSEGPGDIFEQMMAPHVAEKLTDDIAQAIGRDN